MEDDLLRIGEIAGFFGVSVKAIRLYEKKGIIKPVKVDAKTGYRYYSPNQVQTLNALIELKSLGFSLSEIAKLLKGETDTNMLLTALSAKRSAWEEHIAIAENKIDAINQISERITGSKEARRITKLTDEERAWLLVKMVCVENINAQSLLSEALWL